MGEVRMRRVVLDTYVMVSGLLFGGVAGEILQLASGRKVVFLVSPDILGEYEKTLSYPGLGLDQQDIKELMREHVLPLCRKLEPEGGVKSWTGDAAQDMFLLCAEAGGADAIVSGDEGFTAVQDPPVPVLTPGQFLGAV
jgi:uncharacterized protein